MLPRRGSHEMENGLQIDNSVQLIGEAGGTLPPAELPTALSTKREVDQAVMLVKALLLRG